MIQSDTGERKGGGKIRIKKGAGEKWVVLATDNSFPAFPDYFVE